MESRIPRAVVVAIVVGTCISTSTLVFYSAKVGVGMGY
jgi:hypothetical protein